MVLPPLSLHLWCVYTLRCSPSGRLRPSMVFRSSGVTRFLLHRQRWTLDGVELLLQIKPNPSSHRCEIGTRCVRCSGRASSWWWGWEPTGGVARWHHRVLHQSSTVTRDQSCVVLCCVNCGSVLHFLRLLPLELPAKWTNAPVFSWRSRGCSIHDK